MQLGAGTRGAGRLGVRSAVVAMALAVGAVACSSSSGSGAGSTSTTRPPRSYAVGTTTAAFVDSTRITRANGAQPARPERTLVTTVLYPAAGAAADAPRAGAPPAPGPFPLVVFSHGLGANPDAYAGLLHAWTRAGYVVAAPRFPLTSSDAAGGVDAGDVTNQPDDISFVITSMLDASEQPGSALSGLIQPDAVGVAGHSLGGITTLGVAAHTCCRDDRVKAAVVMAGDPLPFPGGKFDYAAAPPILLVHGKEDALVTYQASVDVFNAAAAPKGIVSIAEAGHGAPMDPTGAAFAEVVRTTTEFFDGYLKDDSAALAALAGPAAAGVTVHFVRAPGTTVTLPTTTTRARSLRATATPDAGLRNGQVVTVSWSGFTPGKTVNIVQCSPGAGGDASLCDLKHGKILQPDPTGTGSLPLEIVVGPVGSGTCDADHPGCVVFVNDGGSLDPAASVRIPISFARG